MLFLTCSNRALASDLTEQKKALATLTIEMEQSKKAIEYVPFSCRTLPPYQEPRPDA